MRPYRIIFPCFVEDARVTVEESKATRAFAFTDPPNQLVVYVEGTSEQDAAERFSEALVGTMTAVGLSIVGAPNITVLPSSWTPPTPMKPPF